MRAEMGVRYREAQFSPSEAVGITGLSLGMQRDWRSNKLLRAREGGRASFSPREVAEMRVMVKLRGLGLPLQDCRSVADQAGPAVIFAALSNHLEEAIAVDGPEDTAAELMETLQEHRGRASSLLSLADVPSVEHAYRHALVEKGECFLVRGLDDTTVDEHVEVAGIVNLWAVAEAIVKASPRPLFTIVLGRAA
ncbi:MAG TPA: MerR family transcriptional regulator [Brevundimonas sp.]|nr:MerR family transcriptional regulator [Brevundimonas sp.]